MEREAFLGLFEPNEFNDLYRKLYLRNPKAFEKPVKSWAEFCINYQKEEGEAILPLLPPTAMASFFTEAEYFSDESWGEVNMNSNAQYCPAFLHKLEFIKLIYVFRGSCRFYTEGKWMEMREGNACIVAPQVEQTVFSCADEDVVLNLLIRRSTFFESFWELLETSDGGRIADFFWRMLYHKPGGNFLLLNSRPDLLLEESVMALYEEANLAPVKSRLVMKSMMLSVFAYILRWDEEAVAGIEGQRERKKYPLAGYFLHMRSHLSSVSLSSLAEAFYVSEGYLSRYIRRETGKTFSRPLMEMRMNRARELLVNTECGIERIVSLVGYTDQSIFFRNFRAVYKTTPLAYRKNYGRQKNRFLPFPLSVEEEE